MSDFDLGALVKDHRKKAGLTQLELANLAGVGKTTVFDIEKNMLVDYLMQYRLGKTTEEGHEVAKNVRSIIETNKVQEKLRQETKTSFSSLFKKYDEEKILEWFQLYINLFILDGI